MPTFSSDNDFASMIERYNQEMKQYIQSPLKNEVAEAVAEIDTDTEIEPENTSSTDPLTREIPYPLLNDEPNTNQQTSTEKPQTTPYPQDAVGFLQIQATTARNVLPVEGATVTVIGELDGKQVLHQTVFTDDSGFSPLMTLPAVSAQLSLTPDNAVPYVTYTIRVVKDGFYPTENTKVPIFEGITSRQPVYLIPLPESMQQGDWQVFPDNGPSDL